MDKMTEAQAGEALKAAPSGRSLERQSRDLPVQRHGTSLAMKFVNAVARAAGQANTIPTSLIRYSPPLTLATTRRQPRITRKTSNWLPAATSSSPL